MCGIVAAVSNRDIVPILVQGLQRLEYRGYDSCGVAVHSGGLKRARSVSRVAQLQAQVQTEGIGGGTGIAHTRWATHGAPAVHNAHPHFSHGRGPAQDQPGRVALVHNGIIENHEELRDQLKAQGYVFQSQTDTEVIVHLVDSLYDGDLFDALKAAIAQLHGAYAIAAFCKDEPQRVVGARAGSPLVLGVGLACSAVFLGLGWEPTEQQLAARVREDEAAAAAGEGSVQQPRKVRAHEVEAHMRMMHPAENIRENPNVAQLEQGMMMKRKNDELKPLEKFE
jgi:glucosamine--fructose-6-phosphate aminotransferase (isomerizing)